jgi:two-component system, LytTR family, sensor kinase
VKRSTKIKGLTIFALWSAFGIFSALEGHVESSVLDMKGETWGFAFFSQLSFTTICALLTPAVLFLAARFRVDAKPYWRNLTVHLISSFAFILIAKTLWSSVMYAEQHQMLTWHKWLRNVVYSFDYGMVLYWMVILIVYLLECYHRYQMGRMDAVKLQAELAQAQLRWLKVQVHPHFLFNALHTISALVHEDPEAAERVIARLSDLLRLSLRDGGVQVVPLKQELEHVRMYLDIERARFEERLVVNLSIEDGTEDALVPSLVLQPLVENAIRHGIGKRIRGGEVTISSSRHGARLALSVSDNGVGLPPTGVSPVREGIGLSSIRGRLERLYGRSQSLILRKLGGGGVEALISIPYTKQQTRREDLIHETV